MRDKLRAVRLRVGKNVQRLRLLRGMSQERLAELVGNSAKNMGQVERGEVNVGLDTLALIASALSINLEDLFEGSVRRRPAKQQLFLISARELNLLEATVRRVRTSRRVRQSDRGSE